MTNTLTCDSGVVLFKTRGCELVVHLQPDASAVMRAGSCPCVGGGEGERWPAGG